MSHHGRFCWFELISTDLDAAQAFYSAVLGWTVADAGVPGMDYRLASTPEGTVAGMMARFEGGPGPSWTGYVCVDDVDAATEVAQTAGAAIHRAPMDIPGVGRFAILGDPQGAVLAMLQPLPSYAVARAGLDTPNRVGWHELHASDWRAAWPFYQSLFGWEQSEGFDMGPMGTYQLFRRQGSDHDLGGMMDTPAERPCWLYYFTVAAIDAAVERVTSAGGTIRMGPHQVPGGNWILICADPQGAAFALSSMAR